MKSSRIVLLAALAATSALALGACGDDSSAASPTTANPPASASMAPAAMNIVETAAANPAFSTLVSAVKGAGLAETLPGPGPYTVFAPPKEAFAKLPAGTLDMLVQPANKEKLAAILT